LNNKKEKIKEKFIILRIPVLISFFFNLEKKWHNLMAIEYSTDSQVYSLMKLIIYFNPEKIEEYKTIIENILSHFKFFDFLKIYDPQKTLTLKPQLNYLSVL